MKICAITMVYRDYWALSQWYAHYGRALGPENLYVVAHGVDPKLQELCPEANVFAIPREDLNRFDQIRGNWLNNLQNGLAQVYDWVIRTDADELICLDPAQYESFEDLLSQQERGALFSLGLNLFEFPEDTPLQESEMALAHRPNAVFTGHYSKAWVVRNRIGLKRHGIQVRPKLVPDYPFDMPRGVYMVHLKYANIEACEKADHERQLVARREGRGLPGALWRDATKSSVRHYHRALQLPLAPWEEAEDEAWHALQDPERDIKNGFIRAKFLKFSVRTELPEWFKHYPAP